MSNCLYITVLHVFRKAPARAVRRLVCLALCLAFAAVYAAAASRGGSAEAYSPMLDSIVRMPIGKVLERGDSYFRRGDTDTSLVYYMVACNRLRDNMPDKDRQLCALAHLKKGNVYYMKGGYSSALEAYIKGLKIYETCSEQKETGRFYNNIGSIYCVFLDYEKGLSYYKTAREYCHKYGDKANEFNALANMTGILTFTGDAKTARKAYADMIKLRDTTDVYHNFISNFNHGLILATEQRHSAAIRVFEGSARYAASHHLEPRYLCSAFEQMYKSYMALGNDDSTLVYLRLSEETAQKNGIMHHFVDILYDFSRFYEQHGAMSQAAKYRERFYREKDSIYNMREFDMVKNALFVYEMDKIDRKIASMHASEAEHLLTISLQRKAIAAVSLLSALVCVLLFVAYRQKRRINKSYNDLFAVNRTFVETQELMRRKLREANARLAAAEGASGGAADADETAADAAPRKYSTSRLDDAQRQKLLDAVMNVMENTTEYCSTDFSLERMAALVGSNSKYVSQVINDTFHKNFSVYVNEYRIRLACLRLADKSYYSAYTLSAIAESVGFKSYSAFVAVFRKVVGITPSMYKDMLLRDGEKQQ